MDWFVILTPLAVLGVLALLGFAGCDKVFSIDPVPLPQTVTLRVRVPSDLTVDLARFRWTRPGSTVEESTDTTTRTDEATTFVLTAVVPDAEAGAWRVTCRLEVREGATQANDAAAFDFMLDPETSLSVLFETQGRPAAGNFRVVPVGIE